MTDPRTGGRFRRVRPRTLARTAAVLALATAATTATAGCSGVPGYVERYTAACAVTVDGSGSAEPPPVGFDGRVKLDESLFRFLEDKECRTVEFGPITKASQASSCDTKAIDLDPDADAKTDRGDLRTVKRAEALAAARKMLACAQKYDPGSDVLGGLSRIAVKKPAGDTPFHLLVVSDFVQNDSEFQLGKQDLATEESRKEVIDQLADEGRMPPLKGAYLYPVGYGMKYTKQATASAQFNAFWMELLEGRVKSHVDNSYR